MAGQAGLIDILFRKGFEADDLVDVPSAFYMFGARPMAGLATVTALKRRFEVRCRLAEEPRFVETLPRKGYRFVGAREPLKGDFGEIYTDVIASSLQQKTLAVSRSDSRTAAKQLQSKAPAESFPIGAPSIREGDHTTAPRDRPKRPAIWITTAVAGVTVVVLTFVMSRSGPRPEVPIQPGTSFPKQSPGDGSSPDARSFNWREWLHRSVRRGCTETARTSAGCISPRHHGGASRRGGDSG